MHPLLHLYLPATQNKNVIAGTLTDILDCEDRGQAEEMVDVRWREPGILSADMSIITWNVNNLNVPIKIQIDKVNNKSWPNYMQLTRSSF